MSEKNLWLTITKSRPLPGCEIDMDGCEFYFLDAFVPLDKSLGADSILNAISTVKSTLLEDKLELAEVILCVKFSPEEWIDQTESDEPLHELAAKALESDDVVFGSFRSEEIQDLYHYKHTIQELDK